MTEVAIKLAHHFPRYAGEGVVYVRLVRQHALRIALNKAFVLSDIVDIGSAAVTPLSPDLVRRFEYVLLPRVVALTAKGDLAVNEDERS